MGRLPAVQVNNIGLDMSRDPTQLLHTPKRL
jgi:hypothetical protein